MTKKKSNPGKRGVKCYYTGSRLTLLEENLDQYVSLKFSNRNQFWFEFFTQWWAKYPWKLVDQEEPPLDDDARMAELASVAQGEEQLKAEAEKAAVKRIKQWFAYQAQTKVPGNGSNSWFAILQRLHESANRKPRKRSVVQQFMHEEPSLIDIEFARHFGSAALGMEGVERMNKRFEFAKTLLNQDYSNRIPDLQKRAQEDHERDLAQWSLVLDGIQLAPDVDAARDSLFSATHSILKAIGLYAGCYVTIIAGAIPSGPGNKEYFSAVHYVPDGKASRQNWTEWDMDEFRSGVARPFKKYIKCMEVNPGAKVAITTTIPQAVPGTTPPTTGAPSDSPQPGATTVPNVTAAPKRTARGNHKSHSGDFDEWSDGSTDSEDVSQKRQRTDPIVTRSRRRVVEDSNDVARNSPATLQTAAPLSEGSFGSSDGDALTASGTEFGPVTEETLPRTVGVNVSSNTDPPATAADSDVAITAADQDVAITATDPDVAITAADSDVATTMSAEVALQALTIAEIPKFLSITPKKSKFSIYSYLLTNEDPDFQALLHKYISFEGAAEALGQNGTLPTGGRPSQVTWWIRSARVGTPPSWTSLHNYGSSVIAWWISLQPGWRKLECGTINRSDGAFGSLSQPGVNGLLNVIILAYWWSGALDEVTSGSDIERSRYIWFVSDVSWVLAKLIETV